MDYKKGKKRILYIYNIQLKKLLIFSREENFQLFQEYPTLTFATGSYFF
jgi:hypothetical protein